MFGKPAFNYSDYISNNYVTSSNTMPTHPSLSVVNNANLIAGINGSTAATCAVSSFSNHHNHGSYGQEFTELNQNNNLLNSVYNQMNTNESPRPINSRSNSNTVNTTMNSISNTNNNTDIENLLSRSAALGFGFTHFNTAANYLNAANAVAAAAAAASSSQHNNHHQQQQLHNSINYSSSPSSSSSNSSNNYGLHSSQAYSIPPNHSVSNELTHPLHKQNSHNQNSSTNETKMSLTPTSSSISSASSPNYLSESIESNNIQHSAQVNSTTKNNRHLPSSSSSMWPQQGNSFQNSSKNENNWPVERKSSKLFYFYCTVKVLNYFLFNRCD